jgi:hypothetical protein
MAETRQRRRWLTFSLRGLLLFTLLIACLLGWKLNKVHRQRAAVARIHELGGTVFFSQDASKPNAINKADSPNLLRRLLDNLFTDDVVAVRLSGKQVDNISFLADLPAVVDLSVSGTNVTDLSPISSLAGMKRLDLTACPVRNVAPIKNLTMLERLSLENTQISDIRPLTNLTNLVSLALDGTQVSDLSPLAGMSKLVELKLFFCPNICDAKPLSGLTKLGYLDLSDTAVESIEPLIGLKSLAFLSLSRTTVPQEESQRLRTLLPNCRITHNK